MLFFFDFLKEFDANDYNRDFVVVVVVVVVCLFVCLLVCLVYLQSYVHIVHVLFETLFRGCGGKIFYVTFHKFYRRRKKLSHFTKTQCDEPKLIYSIGKVDAVCLCKSISKYCLLFLLNRANCH